MKLLRKRNILIVIGFIVVVGLIFVSAYLKNVSDYKQAVQEISVDDIDITDVANGVYIGECNVDFIYAKVKATVQGGKMTKLNILEHKTERGKPAEAVINTMMQQQQINVDAISGATNSSKVIEKAVERALKKGM